MDTLHSFTAHDTIPNSYRSLIELALRKKKEDELKKSSMDWLNCKYAREGILMDRLLKLGVKRIKAHRIARNIQ